MRCGSKGDKAGAWRERGGALARRSHYALQRGSGRHCCFEVLRRWEGSECSGELEAAIGEMAGAVVVGPRNRKANGKRTWDWIGSMQRNSSKIILENLFLQKTDS